MSAAASADKGAAVNDWIMHHVTNGPVWHPVPGVDIAAPAGFGVHGIMVVLCALFLVVLFCCLYNKKQVVPTGLTNLLEVFVVFIRDDICIASLGEKDGRRLTPLFLTFFFFIVGMNLMGLIPFFATATGNVNVTCALATIVLMIMVVGSVVKNGPIGFVKAFIPHGVPLPILCIVTPIEFAGMFIKVFALMIRLFANMLAGHIIIFSLLGLVFMFGAAAAPAIGLALGIYVLEILVAFLQAYIFTLLAAMFSGMIINPAH